MANSPGPTAMLGSSAAAWGCTGQLLLGRSSMTVGDMPCSAGHVLLHVLTAALLTLNWPSQWPRRPPWPLSLGTLACCLVHFDAYDPAPTLSVLHRWQPRPPCASTLSQCPHLRSRTLARRWCATTRLYWGLRMDLATSTWRNSGVERHSVLWIHTSLQLNQGKCCQVHLCWY